MTEPNYIAICGEIRHVYRGRPDGIVLAGGAGRRMGRPKAGVVFDGVAMVERAVSQVRPVCGRVVVVSRPEVVLPLMPVEVVFDQREGGPLAALWTGLATVSAPQVIVVACDLPNADPAVALLAEVDRPTVLVDEDGRAQPLCARYDRAAALDAAASLLDAGEHRMSELVTALGPALVPAPPGALRNVNRPGD
jgi:molybdopterin-guanine dinucleotide biosynthesis protein A